MRRAPRDPGRRLFTRALLMRGALQGVGALMAAAVVFVVSVQWRLIESDVRMLTFATLILTNLALILTNRSFSQPMWTTWRAPNPALRWLVAGAAGILAVILYVPLVGDLFRMSRPHAADAIVIVLAAVGALAWMEIVKRCLRRKRSSTA